MKSGYFLPTLFALVLSGCMSVENSNLGKPISDPSKAEIVGFKVKSTGPLPHRIWAGAIDETKSPQYGYPWDQIFPLAPGARKITVQYEGAVMTLLGTTPKPFTAKTEFTLDAIPNVRYITKGRYSEGKVTLWIEKYPSGEVVTQEATVPVAWRDINVHVY